MSDQQPVIIKDPMYQLLRVDNVKAFNIKKEAGQTCDLRGASLRGAKITGCRTIWAPGYATRPTED